MRGLLLLIFLLVSLSYAQYNAIPRFANLGGAAGIFADPVADGRFNPARVGGSLSSIWIPAMVSSTPDLLGGIQLHFAWRWDIIPLEFDLGGIISTPQSSNPASGGNFRLALAVPGLVLPLPDYATVLPIALGAELYAQNYGYRIGSYGSGYSFSSGVRGFGLGLATPDFDLGFNLNEVTVEEQEGSTPAVKGTFAEPIVTARLKNEAFSGVLRYQGGPATQMSLGLGWQTRRETLQLGIWGWAFSNADFRLGSNLELPITEGLSFLASWSLFRDNQTGLRWEPLRLALTYRNLPIDAFLELPLHFQGNVVQSARLHVGISW